MNYKLKLDVSKIDKKRLFKSEKTGAIYLDCVMIESKDNAYGQSHMIIESITKEEREAGNKGTILGNASELEKQPQQTVSAEIEEDDLAF